MFKKVGVSLQQRAKDSAPPNIGSCISGLIRALDLEIIKLILMIVWF